MNMPFNILIIDDEPVMRDSCFQILSRKGCEVSLAENGHIGLFLLERCEYEVVILDLKLTDLSGFDILKIIHKKYPNTIVIVITGYPTVEAAVEAMKMGAYDFIPKPFTPNLLRTVVSRALEKRKLFTGTPSTANDLNNGEDNINTIIGESKVICELKHFIKKAACSDCTVLITGETGTGKELVARALHFNSRRKNRDFITVDSGGLVDSLIESELFGHVKGSFTGADTDRTGRFELAHKGTLFFDEISNMSYRIQGKLLRILQEHEFAKVGASHPQPVDVRIIVATNQNLAKAIMDGNFREDLYYRVNVIPVHIPPLRDRCEDIPLLANYFLKKFCEQKRLPYPERITEKAIKEMMDYDWPGNVRELEHMIKRTVALCDDKEVNPFEVTQENIYNSSISVTNKVPTLEICSIEKEHIDKILKKFHYNKTQTAKALGVDRKTLRSKIKKYGICDKKMF